jgi:hypothetical protein
MEAVRAGGPPSHPGAGTLPITISGLGGGGTLSAPGSMGNRTPPAPASPAASHTSHSAAMAALGGGLPRAGTAASARAASERTSSGGDDDFPLDTEEAAPAKAAAVGEPEPSSRLGFPRRAGARSCGGLLSVD